MTAPVDWRGMFSRYIDAVGENEGVSFLYTGDWTEQEWAAIQALTDLPYSDEDYAKDLAIGGPHLAVAP